jgi:hypothetical protein
MGTKRPWVVEVFNLWRQARDVPQMCHECGMMFSRPKCRAGQLIRRSWWGTGIYHSEHNLAKEPLRFIQCWVVPCKCTGRYWKCHNAKTIWVWWFDWWFLSVSRWLVQPESEVSVVQNGSNLSAVSKVPRSRGLKPNYGSAVGNADAAAARRDQWAHLAFWSNVWQNKVWKFETG